MADNWQAADTPPWLKEEAKPSAGPNWQAADTPPWARKEEPKSVVSQALKPVTSYPETQKEIAHEGLEQISRGVGQLTEPTGGDLWKSAKAATKGVANVGLGAIGYVASPITAGYRTLLGKPVEEITGIPKEYTEFAAQLATPGLGLPRLPGPRAPTLTGAEARAAKKLEAGAEDIGAVKERLKTEAPEIVPGSQQTTFEMTGDAGLGALERKARVRSPTGFVKQGEERAAARLEALEGQQPTGSVADTVEHLRQSRAREQWALEQDVALADQRAREAARLPGGDIDPATHGNVMRQELRNAEDVERAGERTLWQRLDPNNELSANPQPLQVTERQIYGTMPEGGAAEASLSPAERQIAGVIQNYRNIIPYQELRDLRSLINTRLREELWANGQSPAYARLSRLRQGVANAEEMVFNELGQRQPAVAQQMREASAATRQRAERFGTKPISDVLQREGSAGPYKIEPAGVTDKLLPPGNKGYDVASSYLRAVGNDGLEVYTDALAAKLRREVIRPDGSTDPRKLAGFVRRHDGVLRAVSERDGGAFVQSLQDIGRAEERVAAGAVRQRALTERWEDGELGKLIGASDPEQAMNIVGGIFGRVDSVPRAQALMREASASPAAVQGLRRAVQLWVRRNYVGTAEAAGGTPMIQPRMFQNFMKENEAALRQIMLPEQVDAWKAIATEMGRTSRIAQTKTLPGSDTAQNLLSVGEQWPLKVAGWIADMIAGQVLTGAPVPIVHGVKAGIKGVLGQLKARGITSANQILDAAMLDPELARMLLTTAKAPSRFARVPGAVGRVGAINAPSLTSGTARQAGGGVPAIGGVGGRPDGATAPFGSGTARQRSDQAVSYGRAQGHWQAYQEGGAVQQPQQPRPREQLGAALTGAGPFGGSPVGGGEMTGGTFKAKTKALPPLMRQEIIDTLRRHGIPGTDWADERTRGVDSRAEGMAEGGEVNDRMSGGYAEALDHIDRMEKGEAPLPLPGQSRGLSSTAGPTVTSTMRKEDIPAPRTNEAGETLPTYVLKNWGEGLAHLMGTPGRVYKQGMTDEDVEFGPQMAMMMAGARTPFRAQGDLGIFGGRGAKTANLDMLAKAEQMHAEGVPKESIRNQTGWHLGPEGKWRFEISDVGSYVNPTERIQAPTGSEAASRPSGYRAGTMEEIFHHPELYKAYPQLKDMPASVELSEGIKPGGGFLPPESQGLLGISRGGKDVGSIEVRAPYASDRAGELSGRRIMLHELQHGVQSQEGFAPGGNPNALPFSERQIANIAKKKAEEAGIPWSTIDPLERKKLQRATRQSIYEMYAGEVEARNVEARRGFPPGTGSPPWETESIPRHLQLIPVDEGAALGLRPQKGQKPFKPAVQARVEAPNIHPSEFDRPLFDYSRMAEVPNVPQFGLPRIIPVRGVPEHILRLGDPSNMERTNRIVQMGMSHGGPEWYNTMPLRERYVGEVGPAKGPENWESYLKYVGATSPRSPVPLNVSVASYYDMLAAQGRPFPQPVRKGTNWSMPRGQLPEGYGSLAQATNAQNAAMIREHGGWPAWTFFDKPKPPSFTSNLMGNYWPVTSDVHNVSMLNLRGPRGNRLIMPPHPYYGYIEGLQQGPLGAGQFIDLAPAQYQASGWIPWAAGYRDVGRYGDVTGGSPKKLEAYSQPFIKVVEDRVKAKARELGWSPEQTLRAFLRKEIAIAGVPAAAIPLLQDHLQQAGQGER